MYSVKAVWFRELALIFLFFLIFYTQEIRAELKAVCADISVSDGSLQLNDNERVLVCGANKGIAGWVSVPLPQAQLHLSAILKNMGYLQPRFERIEDRLIVTKGPKSEIKTFIVEGADSVLRPEKKRKVIKEVLAPETLNDVEAWANLQMRTQGYACPELRVEGHAWDESVLVKAMPNGQKRYGALATDDLQGLNPDALLRYQPFEKGQLYNIRETQIMSNRLLADGLFQSAFFETSCEEEWANLKLRTSIGKPRILRFAVGGSSEELPFVDFSFRNARLDEMASSFSASLHSSPVLHSLNLSSELYWINGWPRTYIGPRLRIARESESAYETDSGKSGVDIGHMWDLWGVRFSARAGPTYNYFKTSRGAGPEDVKYPTFDTSVKMFSHLYESTMRQQYEGWTADISARSRRRGLGSDVNVSRYEIDFKHLWNVGDYSPPLFVLGSRVQSIAVDTIDLSDSDALNSVPPDDRVYVGGNDNLRGFKRKSINNDGNGYLTFLYFGFELRVIEELPYHLEPFLLFDAGRVGRGRYSVGQETFLSEGVGLRWPSPFGTLRASLARGHTIYEDDATNPVYPSQWVFYFSFGQEF